MAMATVEALQEHVFLGNVSFDVQSIWLVGWSGGRMDGWMVGRINGGWDVSVCWCGLDGWVRGVDERTEHENRE